MQLVRNAFRTQRNSHATQLARNATRTQRNSHATLLVRNATRTQRNITRMQRSSNATQHISNAHQKLQIALPWCSNSTAQQFKCPTTKFLKITTSGNELNYTASQIDLRGQTAWIAWLSCLICAAKQLDLHGQATWFARSSNMVKRQIKISQTQYFLRHLFNGINYHPIINIGWNSPGEGDEKWPAKKSRIHSLWMWPFSCLGFSKT